MNKDNSEYEIDREITGKLAIESNAELQDRVEELEEENKNLKEKLDKIQDEYDELYIEKCNASNQWKCCEAENKELKEDVDFFRQCYLDLKKLCEKEGFLLSNEEVIKMLNLDEIK